MVGDPERGLEHPGEHLRAHISAVPTCATCPWLSTTIRSAYAAAKFRSCTTITMVAELVRGHPQLSHHRHRVPDVEIVQRLVSRMARCLGQHHRHVRPLPLPTGEWSRYRSVISSNFRNAIARSICSWSAAVAAPAVGELSEPHQVADREAGDEAVLLPQDRQQFGQFPPRVVARPAPRSSPDRRWGDVPAHDGQQGGLAGPVRPYQRVILPAGPGRSGLDPVSPYTLSPRYRDHRLPSARVDEEEQAPANSMIT